MVTQKISTPDTPAKAVPAASLPPSRLVSWFITSAIVGWALAYNVMRMAGRSPRGAAYVSLLVGIGFGIVIFALSVLVWRRIVGGARYQAPHLNEIPPPARLDARQRGAVEILWPAVAILAIVALVTGAVLIWSWFDSDGSRSATRVVIGAWDLLAGAWLTFEAGRLKALDAEAVESIGTAGLLTAVLAGVALSQDMYPTAQGTLVVVSGVTAALAFYAGWRLLGSRGFPFATVGAMVVGGLALVVPLVT